ncbi:MAG: DUF1963 domain-containing protein [Gammaproteobacteria bacterium]|nr:DUF1963 domain-containing protein [Gammaproteobacteria bacterium]
MDNHTPLSCLHCALFSNSDNALLLQLFSDELVGWQWGDLSHIVFVVPRSEISECRFDNVLAIVQG